MKHKTLNTSILILLLLLIGCTKSSKVKNLSFYYWRSNFNLSENDFSFFSKNKVKKIYAKYFDVKWDKNLKTEKFIDMIKIGSNTIDDIDIIPVIYITYETLLNYKLENINNLSSSILDKINDINFSYGIKKYCEIQIDFDWNNTTKEKYFKLIKTLKDNLKNKKIIISSTIRLHQVKYFKKTGVPPADKGIIMIYQTDDVSDFSIDNSLLSVDMAKEYLKNIAKYPIQYDIALPIYTWTLQFDYTKKLVRIIRDDFKYSEDDYNKIGDNRFEAKRDLFLKNKRIMKYDFLKVEKTRIEDCLRITDFVQKRSTQAGFNIIFFDYNTETINNFTKGNKNGFKSFIY